MKFQDREYRLNPKATDLHVATFVKAIEGTGSGYIAIDNWAMAAKQLCFIIDGCDFAEYDPETRDGQLYLTATALAELLPLLRDEVVNRPQMTPERFSEIVNQMAELQSQLNLMKGD